MGVNQLSALQDCSFKCVKYKERSQFSKSTTAVLPVMYIMAWIQRITWLLPHHQGSFGIVFIFRMANLFGNCREFHTKVLIWPGAEESACHSKVGWGEPNMPLPDMLQHLSTTSRDRPMMSQELNQEGRWFVCPSICLLQGSLAIVIAGGYHGCNWITGQYSLLVHKTAFRMPTPSHAEEGVFPQMQWSCCNNRVVCSL